MLYTTVQVMAQAQQESLLGECSKSSATDGRHKECKTVGKKISCNREHWTTVKDLNIRQISIFGQKHDKD